MQHTTIAVDLAKSVFEVAVSQRPGKVAEAQATVARTVFAPSRGARAVDRRDGSLWNRALLGAGGRSAGPSRRAATAAAVRPYVLATRRMA